MASGSIQPGIYTQVSLDMKQKRVQQVKKAIPLVLILLGIGGLGVAVVGIAGLGGALSNLNQVQAITMLSVGGGGGILCIVGAIVAKVKYSPSISLELHGGGSTIDALYEGDGTGILDVAYCYPQWGFGCIVDGTGHNNPNMQKHLRQHFDEFIKVYIQGLGSIKTQKEMDQYFGNMILNLQQRFRDRNLPLNRVLVNPEKRQPGTFLDSTYKPAMSFAQVVRSGDKLVLFTAQAADTCIVVEMPDGTLHATQKITSHGVGDDVTPVTVATYEITGAKRVIGFSDGIGDFITFEELREVLTSTENSAELLPALKAKVASTRVVAPDATAAHGGRFKTYDRAHQDDVGLFVLEI